MLNWYSPGSWTEEIRDRLNNLNSVYGETGYLIHRDEGSVGNVILTITGEPTIPRIKWVPNAFNLVGFHIDPASIPLYDDFFSGSPAHAGQEIYVLDNTAGNWVRVTDPHVMMTPGEAFWVHCKGSSNFTGPLSVQLESVSGISFGASLDEQDVVLRNASQVTKTVSVAIDAPYANDPKLHYWQADPSSGSGAWLDVAGGTPLKVDIVAGSEERVRLGVVRPGLAEGVPYRTNIVISDGKAMRIVLPVSVTDVSTAGLWVGDVLIDKVQYKGGGDGSPASVGSPYGYRIILHVDAGRNVRVLREVAQLWKDATESEPGHYVLVVNPALLGDYKGTGLRDGKLVGRRISATNFNFKKPITATGSFERGGTLSFEVGIDPGDETNPFLHKFHKDHQEGKSYAVTRGISLGFALDPAGGGRTAWSQGWLGQ